ncbi:MAG: cation diffusion facilitator family transporter [Syntrophorhabdus sp.]
MSDFNAARVDLGKGQRTALYASIITLLLAVTKALVGYGFHSPLLVADGFHTLSDFTVIFASWFGLWLASRKKTERFPYGLYKAETLVSFIIGLFISWAGIELLIEGIRKFGSHPLTGNFPLLPIMVSCVSMAIGYFLARNEMATGRAINSQSLKAIAQDSYLNIAVSFSVLAGIVGAYFSIPYVEGALLFIISLLILKLGLETIWFSLLILLDANLDRQLQSDITEGILEIHGVTGVKDVKVRQAGPFRLVECNIESAPRAPLHRTHGLADKVENYIKGTFPNIESVYVHIEPGRNETIMAIIPVKDINGLDSKVYGHFGRAPYFLIIKIGRDTVDIVDFYYNEYLKKGEKIHVGVKVIRDIIKYGVNELFTREIGEISFHMLKDNFVDIYRARENESVREVIERYRHGTIETLDSPTHLAETSQVESALDLEDHAQ